MAGWTQLDSPELSCWLMAVLTRSSSCSSELSRQSSRSETLSGSLDILQQEVLVRKEVLVGSRTSWKLTAVQFNDLIEKTKFNSFCFQNFVRFSDL